MGKDADDALCLERSPFLLRVRPQPFRWRFARRGCGRRAPATGRRSGWCGVGVTGGVLDVLPRPVMVEQIRDQQDAK